MIDPNVTDTRQTLADLVEQQHFNKQHTPDVIAIADEQYNSLGGN